MQMSALLALSLATLIHAADSKPKVRAITAFIRITPATYAADVDATMKFLNAAKAEYQAAGYEVETVRVVTQPLADYIRGLSHADAVALVKKYGGLVEKGGGRPNLGALLLNPSDDHFTTDVAIDVFASSGINGSLIVATDAGIRWNSVQEAARVIHTLASKSPHGDGNFNFAAAAIVKPYTPFYPAAWHDSPGHMFTVGLESANIVQDVFGSTREPGEAERRLADALGRHVRAAEATAVRIASKSGWTYMGIDPTPAPMGDVSIGAAIESFTGAPFGGPGTMTAAGIITRAVQAAPVKQAGYSGLMVPVLEDNLLAKRWAERTYTMDALLAYSSVCAAGLDTVPLPGDITQEQIARIIGDVATLAWKWRKPLAIRLLPAPGKKPGDRTQFGESRMTNTTLQPLQ